MRTKDMLEPFDHRAHKPGNVDMDRGVRTYLLGSLLGALGSNLSVRHCREWWLAIFWEVSRDFGLEHTSGAKPWEMEIKTYC